MTTRDPSPDTGVRERAGVGLLRAGADLARQRQAVIRGVSGEPDTQARARALTDLASAAWPELVLMWLGWRLLPRDALTRRASPPSA